MVGIKLKRTPEQWVEEGVWYAPDWDDNQDHLVEHRMLSELERPLDKGEKERLEYLTSILSQLCYVQIQPYTAGEYQRARAKSPHLGMEVKLKGRKAGVVTGDRDAAEAEFMCDVVRARMTGAQNLWMEGADGNPIEIKNGEDLVKAIRGSDDNAWGLIVDIFSAIKDLSHLEQGRKKA